MAEKQRSVLERWYKNYYYFPSIGLDWKHLRYRPVMDTLRKEGGSGGIPGPFFWTGDTLDVLEFNITYLLGC